MKYLIAALLLLIPLAAQAQTQNQSSGILVWADASEDASDTGNEVCAKTDQPPQWFLIGGECVSVFVPGSATEVACDTDMTGSGTLSGYYMVLCR